MIVKLSDIKHMHDLSDYRTASSLLGVPRYLKQYENVYMIKRRLKMIVIIILSTTETE